MSDMRANVFELLKQMPAIIVATTYAGLRAQLGSACRLSK
jgi:hypothetical protein